MNQKHLPPLNWLRTFEVSARLLSFTQAAQELHLTQGAISQQIRLLEGHLGVALFQRLPRGLKLTDEGKSYLPVVQDSISRLAAGTRELFGQDERTPIKIQGSLSFFVHWLAPRLPDFQRQHPNIDIRYISTLWVKDDATNDLEIRWGNGHWPGHVSQRLSWDTLIPVCSPALLHSRPIQTTADLTEHTLLHVLGYEEGWGYWLNRVNENNVDPSRGIQLDTLLAALKLAEVGAGIALARSSMVEEQLTSGTLVTPFAERIPASESFYLVRTSGQTLTPEVALFVDWLERLEKG